MAQRICPVCRDSFTPTTHNQICCPPTDEDRARVKGQPRSRCARAYMNAKQRGTLDQLLARARRPGLPFSCVHCDNHCIPGENVAPHATRFCGRDCKAAWHHANSESPSSQPEAERRYNRLSSQRRKHQRREAELLDPSYWTMKTMAWRAIVRHDPCAYCGKRPSGGIDHIEPTMGSGDRSDWTNWTGCCKECNQAKQTLPLLLALSWVPLCRRYHDKRRQFFSPVKVS